MLKALETAYETDDISFVHDDAARRVCKGKNPEFNMGKTLYQTIAENTEKELIVISPYLIVTPEMENLIKYLVIEKNVFVKFITNSAESNDQPVATAGYLATRSRLMNILNKNTGQKIRIYEYQNLSNPQLTDGNGKILIAGKAIDTIHAKVVLMDNKKAYVGSYNWDYRSQNLNSEIGVIMALDGSKFAGPAKDLRNRAAIMLKTSNIVQPNGTTNGEEKVSLALTELEKKQLDTIMKERREAVKFWEKLLSLPIVGELLLNQL